MAVHNGSKHLAAQLCSIVRQTHKGWRLLVSDDGSTDGSRDLLRDFAANGHDITVLQGPRQGPAANFMHLIRKFPDHASATEWMAFSDQDDVWMPERLERGFRVLHDIDSDRPALFCSRSLITDEALQNPRLSLGQPKLPGFGNALVQNIASGNTILLNPAAARLISGAAPEAGCVVLHDWWIYQLITGAGGVVVHEDRPLIYYRQHDGNYIGANYSARARLRRLFLLLKGRIREWNEINIAALRRSAHRLTPENQTLLNEFARMRQDFILRRLWRMGRFGLYRQHLPGTCALWVAAVLGRL